MSVLFFGVQPHYQDWWVMNSKGLKKKKTRIAEDMLKVTTWISNSLVVLAWTRIHYQKEQLGKYIPYL